AVKSSNRIAVRGLYTTPPPSRGTGMGEGGRPNLPRPSPLVGEGSGEGGKTQPSILSILMAGSARSQPQSFVVECPLTTQSQEPSKPKSAYVEEAVQMAVDARWDEAAEVNRYI